MAFNLTEKRLHALRMIQQRPGILASALTELCETREKVCGKEWNGFMRGRTGAQGATRWGAAYAKKLIAAGLVRYRMTTALGEPITAGWAALYLTPLGERVARDGKMHEKVGAP